MCDLPSVLDVVTRKARVEHTCCECGCTIERGEHYSAIAGCWYGAWSHYAQCLECARAMSIARWYCSRWELDHGEGPAFGEVWEWWRNDARDAPMDPEIATMRGWRKGA